MTVAAAHVLVGLDTQFVEVAVGGGAASISTYSSLSTSPPTGGVSIVEEGRVGARHRRRRAGACSGNARIRPNGRTVAELADGIVTPTRYGAIRAQRTLWCSPAEIAVTAPRPETATGVDESVFVPLPSSPMPLAPQQTTVPLESSAHV